jgi:hypothetical protein
MTTKTQTLTAQQYLDAETAPMLAKMREVLCVRLRAMDVPRDVIAATVARVERKRDADPTSSAASRVGMMRGDEHRSI